MNITLTEKEAMAILKRVVDTTKEDDAHDICEMMDAIDPLYKQLAGGIRG